MQHSAIIGLCSLSVPIGLTVVASWFDLRSQDREIPDWIPLSLFIWATLATLIVWIATASASFGAKLGIGPAEMAVIHKNCWPSYGIGLAVGIVVGVLMVAAAKFGGADAKLLMALGATLGWRGFLIMFIVMGLVGGVLSIVAHLRGQRTLPYVPAIAAGVIGYACLYGWTAWVASNQRLGA